MKRALAPGLVLLACVSPAQAFEMATVFVGNPGNADDTHGDGYGGVKYGYNIGTFEVTAGQYTEFLNAVAATDTYGLYDPGMADPSGAQGCNIQRTGSPGSYTYNVAADWADRPVNYVSWGDAARFCNWLHHGQPAGAQDLTTTEDGSYHLSGAASDEELTAAMRKPDATWVIPSEDEWCKAAYHCNDGVTGNYWDYPTGSDMPPTPEAPPGSDMTNGSANHYTGGYIDPVYYRTEGGAYAAKPSDSAYGTFDQGGNVREWTEAVILGTYPCRVLRGGSFASGYGTLSATGRSQLMPTANDDQVGFRVAYVGSPIPAVSTWGLVVMALLGLVAGTLMFRKRQVT